MYEHVRNAAHRYHYLYKSKQITFEIVHDDDFDTLKMNLQSNKKNKGAIYEQRRNLGMRKHCRMKLKLDHGNGHTDIRKHYRIKQTPMNNL